MDPVQGQLMGQTDFSGKKPEVNARPSGCRSSHKQTLRIKRHHSCQETAGKSIRKNTPREKRVSIKLVPDSQSTKPA